MAIVVGGLTLTTVGGFAEDLNLNDQQEIQETNCKATDQNLQEGSQESGCLLGSQEDICQEN